MTLLDLPHGKTQINESQKFNATDRAANTGDDAENTNERDSSHPFSSGSVVKTPFYALASLKLSFTQSASPPIFQNVVVPGQSLAAGKVPAHGCSELN